MGIFFSPQTVWKNMGARKFLIIAMSLGLEMLRSLCNLLLRPYQIFFPPQALKGLIILPQDFARTLHVGGGWAKVPDTIKLSRAIFDDQHVSTFLLLTA